MNRTVRIHEIDRNITRETIEQVFGQFGRIRKIRLPQSAAESDAHVEYLTRAQAKHAIEQLDCTTLNSIYGRKKKAKQVHSEFLWRLSMLKSDHMWEEDPRDTTKVEKEIVKEKKKNMAYIESLKGSVVLNAEMAQRKVIKYMEETDSRPAITSAKSENTTGQ